MRPPWSRRELTQPSTVMLLFKKFSDSVAKTLIGYIISYNWENKFILICASLTSEIFHEFLNGKIARLTPDGGLARRFFLKFMKNIGFAQCLELNSL